VTYLIDSDWLIDYLSGRIPAVSFVSSLLPSKPAISIITYAEVYEGIYFGRDPRRSEEGFLDFLQSAEVLGISQPVARLWAQLLGTLRQAGRIIPQPDLFIAATALHHDLTLVTRNRRHFERIPDLKLLSAPPEQTET
jgi:tRNA(fMet)-specific endonuclease VapC